MFYIFDAYQLKLTKSQQSKVKLIVALAPPNIAVLTEQHTLFIFNIETADMIYKQQLASRPRRIAYHQHTNSIILHCPDQQAIFQLNLANMKISSIFQFKASHHYHTEHVIMREKDYMSSILLLTFKFSNLFIAPYEKLQERKKGLLVFERKVEGWVSSNKDINQSDTLVDKIDEVSKIVTWKQCASNGSFAYTIFDLLNNSEEKITLRSNSFNSYTVVKSIKLDKNNKVLIYANHKNPQILYFNQQVQNHSQHLLTNTLWSLTLPRYNLNLSISSLQGSNGRLQIREAEHGNIIESIEGKFSQISVGQDGKWMIDYENEQAASYQIRMRVIKIYDRKILLANLIEKWRAKIKWSDGLSRDIFDMLA